jgi:hypothetical protein
MNDETWVYHCMCSHGATLYVGIANNVRRRLGQHKRKDWWPEVDVVIADLYPTRWQAEDVEAHYVGQGSRSQLRNELLMVDEPEPPHPWILRQYWGFDDAGHLEAGEPFENIWDHRRSA